ncbi:type I glyceraldehyde-3-phosphate dehydrogenase [bacterium]|nr:type I glyceraldehyde-3-phosphate dehydrogenase [bacterium]
MLRIAINGFGRVGRNIVRALLEGKHSNDMSIVAINDLAEPELLAHLLEYDSTLGRSSHPVSLNERELSMGDQSMTLYKEPDPSKLPWGELEIDICFECTGRFASKEKASQHLAAGAKKVLVSQPCADADITTVYGVNHLAIKPEYTIISNASCTTNCLAPIVAALHPLIDIQSGLMTTIHAYTNDQNLLDQPSNDAFRSRSATASMIPTRTGAAKAVGLVLPELEGKLHGMAVRVPTANVSLVDLVLVGKNTVDIDAVHQCFIEASQNTLRGVLSTNAKPLVSIDFQKNTHSSIVDTNHTAILGKQLKIMSWYDNEWGFSNRMLDVAKHISQL